MFFNIIASTVSRVAVDSSELLTQSTLPTYDVSITLPYDINDLFKSLVIPYIPITDTDTDSTLGPTSTGGASQASHSDSNSDSNTDPYTAFYNAIGTVKAAWADFESDDATKITFKKLMVDVVRQVLDTKDSNSSVLNDTNKGAFEISENKVASWLQGTDPSSFGALVMTAEQVQNLIEQVRVNQKYEQEDSTKFGECKLDAGDKLGVTIELYSAGGAADADNQKLDLHLYLKQTPPVAESQSTLPATPLVAESQSTLPATVTVSKAVPASAQGTYEPYSSPNISQNSGMGFGFRFENERNKPMTIKPTGEGKIRKGYLAYYTFNVDPIDVSIAANWKITVSETEIVFEQA